MALPDLIIPDVHEDIVTVERILRHYRPKVRRFIFLGDYLDSWTHTPDTAARTVAFLAEAVADPQVDLLLGNHDMQYFWPGAGFGCSGFAQETLHMVRLRLPLVARLRLEDVHGRILLHRYGWLLSHAGVHPRFVKDACTEARATAAEHAAYQSLVDRSNSHWFWDAGGYTPAGPLWLRWHEFVDDLHLPPQVVGHTHQQVPGQKGRSWNLDTQLRHVALLAPDGTLNVEPTTGLRRG